MATEQEESMPVETPSLFAQVIQEHLDLKRRNAALEHEMPIEKYLADDPFENHPLFKTEEQARVEDTMDGVQSIVDEPTMLDWPTAEDTFIDTPAEPEQPAAPDEPSDETLWTRSRDFDWGD
jgi:hypothetical protein